MLGEGGERDGGLRNKGPRKHPTRRETKGDKQRHRPLKPGTGGIQHEGKQRRQVEAPATAKQASNTKGDKGRQVEVKMF